MTDDTKPRPTPQYLTGSYTCWLPVFKQGDDLHGHLDCEETVADAFEALARQYEAAAAVCRRMAGVAREVPEMVVHADTHHIGVSGPVGRLEGLADEGLLGREDHDDEREATEAAFTEQLVDDRDGRGPFTAEDAVARIAEIDPDLAGLNPAWVAETLEGMIGEGSLRRVGAGAYEVVPEDDEG